MPTSADAQRRAEACNLAAPSTRLDAGCVFELDAIEKAAEMGPRRLRSVTDVLGINCPPMWPEWTVDDETPPCNAAAAKFVLVWSPWRRRLCIHEAGHALIACLTQVPYCE